MISQVTEYKKARANHSDYVADVNIKKDKDLMVHFDDLTEQQQSQFYIPRLINHKTGKTVNIGDIVTDSDGNKCTVTYFTEPHKSSSSGKVCVDDGNGEREYYVTVFGLEWINRSDR